MSSFLSPADQALAEEFLNQGHIVAPVDDPEGLARIRAAVVELAAAQLGVARPQDEAAFLNGIHTRVAPEALNALRLAVFEGLNGLGWLRERYFGLARGMLEALAGNELAMQRRINLSIQLPGDESSLLPVHADVWSGDSPFELVLWLPLVDCYGSKSMFLLPPGPNAAAEARMAALGSSEALFADIEPELAWLDVPYGSALVFTQNLMHGNRINHEAESRWSMNCRFKSLFSPYAQKRLGEFFAPITMRPATRLGMTYALPEGFAGASG